MPPCLSLHISLQSFLINCNGKLSPSPLTVVLFFKILDFAVVLCWEEKLNKLSKTQWKDLEACLFHMVMNAYGAGCENTNFLF